MTTLLLAVIPNKLALAEEHWENRISILLGKKHLDKDDFVDNKHPAFGINLDIKRKSWPVSIAVDLMSSGEEIKSEHRKIERVTGGLHLGIRKYWLFNNIEPYVGGGINLAVAERKKIINNQIEKQDDDDTGYWLATGVNWKFDNQIFIGAEVRYSDAEVTLFDSKINTGGLYSVFKVGYLF
ncbi:outer membrane beta-barrel protein [Thalassotalea agariperforans]